MQSKRKRTLAMDDRTTTEDARAMVDDAAPLFTKSERKMAKDVSVFLTGDSLTLTACDDVLCYR